MEYIYYDGYVLRSLYFGLNSDWKLTCHPWNIFWSNNKMPHYQWLMKVKVTSLRSCCLRYDFYFFLNLYFLFGHQNLSCGIIINYVFYFFKTCNLSGNLGKTLQHVVVTRPHRKGVPLSINMIILGFGFGWRLHTLPRQLHCLANEELLQNIWEVALSYLDTNMGKVFKK